MKIAIPIKEKSIKSSINDSFGRAPYFLIYSTVTKESVFLDNRAVAEQGGAGIRAAQVIADNGVRALITIGVGKMQKNYSGMLKFLFTKQKKEMQSKI